MTNCTPENQCDGCKAALHCMPTPIADGAIDPPPYELGCDPPGTHISMKLGPGAILPMMDIPDMVNEPPHYKGSKFECIDVIEDFQLGFHLGNAVKYILRAGKKGNRLEDLKKAVWYIQREINNV